MESQCLGAKLPDTANVAIQIKDTQVHEQHATKQNGLKAVSYTHLDVYKRQVY